MNITKNILVSIPHAGISCPPEIPLKSLSDYQQELAINNVDWFTNHLYDFRDILDNHQVVFPYNQVLINVNRHPDNLEESVPLSVDDISVYKNGQEPSSELRKHLIRKYHYRFHNDIASYQKIFIFDGHSTVTGLADAGGDVVKDDIIISDWQMSKHDPPGGIKTAPEGFLDVYAEELDRQFSGFQIKLSTNTTYSSTYGYIMASHGWDGKSIKGSRVPLILQETNEKLYIKNGIPDVLMIEELRRIFAESLTKMLVRMNQTIKRR